jgi:hypothetical protein
MREFRRVSLDGKGGDIIADRGESNLRLEEPDMYTKPESMFGSESHKPSEWAWAEREEDERITGAKPIPANVWKGPEYIPKKSWSGTDQDYNPFASSGSEQEALMQATKEMQEMNQSFNLEYLQLQQDMQNQNRQFTLVSNIMKTKHDTAKSAINNVR